MTNPLWFLPAFVVVLAVGVWLGARTSDAVDRVLTRIARAAFDRFVTDSPERARTVEAAYYRANYRAYAAKTYLFAALALVAGAVGGAYALAGFLLVVEPLVHALSGLPRTITAPLGIGSEFELVVSERARWTIVLVGGLLSGLGLSVVSYAMRWQLPESHAEVRRRSIDEGLPRTVAFMYALSRGGLSFPILLRTLTEHSEVYGETARELRVAAREMDTFGRDMISAIHRTARRTPSEGFKTFAENLASVLQSGSDLSEFLSQQYDRYQEEAEQRQEDVLEYLATVAEAYVTVFVAGVLFLVTILLVFGLTTADTLWLLQLLAYLIVPLGNVGVMVYLDQTLDALGIARRSGDRILDRIPVETPSTATPAAGSARADGGVSGEREALRQLERFDRLARVKGLLRNPSRTVRRNPASILYVTVPVAVAALALRLPGALQGSGVSVRVLDDLIVQSVLLVLIPYAVVRELYKRRIDGIEAAMPDLLERLASLNESGMSVVEGFDRVRGSDLGVLTPEADRIWRDLEYGSNVDDALIRFGRRVRTTAITRVVVLLTNAMRASGQIGSVLRIAADQARADLRMRRRRRQQMLTYLVVIYVAFLVFLVIIIAVQEVLIPSLPETVPTLDQDANRLGVNVDQFERLASVDKAAYALVFFHTALVQAVLSGFVGGQLGEGSLKDGAKHAAVLLTVAYVAFLLLTGPVASIGALGATSTGDELTVQEVSLSDGGFVAVYDDDVNGTRLGHSAYLPPGTHHDVSVALDRPIRADSDVRVVVHRDTNGDGRFEFDPPHRPAAGQVDRPYPSLADGAAPGVELGVVSVGD